MNNEEKADVLKRLDAIVLLLMNLIPRNAEAPSVRDQIRLLASVGIGPAEIGRMLGKSTSAITSELAKMNKKHRK